jgi:phytoene dehydrogenase-like protein
MSQQDHYDCIIIGAGMSGLAAAIRLSMYNKKILILEKHSISGGLNSYYNRGKRKFDVGLHALTNFVSKDQRGKPFNKLMKQLRIPYDDFQLTPQKYSLIKFPDQTLRFTNDLKRTH